MDPIYEMHVTVVAYVWAHTKPNELMICVSPLLLSVVVWHTHCVKRRLTADSRYSVEMDSVEVSTPDLQSIISGMRHLQLTRYSSWFSKYAPRSHAPGRIYPTRFGHSLVALSFALSTYDTLITLSKEVEYVWQKRWSYSKTLYVILWFGTLGFQLFTLMSEFLLFPCLLGYSDGTKSY